MDPNSFYALQPRRPKAGHALPSRKHPTVSGPRGYKEYRARRTPMAFRIGGRDAWFAPRIAFALHGEDVLAKSLQYFFFLACAPHEGHGDYLSLSRSTNGILCKPLRPFRLFDQEVETLPSPPARAPGPRSRPFDGLHNVH